MCRARIGAFHLPEAQFTSQTLYGQRVRKARSSRSGLSKAKTPIQDSIFFISDTPSPSVVVYSAHGCRAECFPRTALSLVASSDGLDDECIGQGVKKIEVIGIAEFFAGQVLINLWVVM